MELDHKKNISASVYIDNTKIIDLSNSRVFGKVEDNEVFIYIKNDASGRTIKLVMQENAELVDDKDI